MFPQVGSGRAFVRVAVEQVVQQNVVQGMSQIHSRREAFEPEVILRICQRNTGGYWGSLLRLVQL